MVRHHCRASAASRSLVTSGIIPLPVLRAHCTTTGYEPKRRYHSVQSVRNWHSFKRTGSTLRISPGIHL